MQLDSIEDYEHLGEHLAAIDAPLEAFAAAHQYAVIRRGRYPNRRITHEGPVVRSIHITMDMDERGERFDHFLGLSKLRSGSGQVDLLGTSNTDVTIHRLARKSVHDRGYE